MLNNEKMNDGIASGARTVTHLADYFDELKQSALRLAGEVSATERGHFLPSEEELIRPLLVSYWKSRCALFDLIRSLRIGHFGEKDQQSTFLVAFGAALILVDAARFLRESFNNNYQLRKMWNQPALEFGIPGGTYDAVQKSLMSARHAWHLYHACQYFELQNDTLRAASREHGLQRVVAVIDRLRHRLDVTLIRFSCTKLRVRSSQIVREMGRTTFVRALYGLQKLMAGMMADVYVRPGHQPNIPDHIAGLLERILAPGDVLVVRKEYALTNYFLPGRWPHAALYLGNKRSLHELGFGLDFLAKSSSHAGLPPTPSETTSFAERSHCVLESMKDGVRIRSLHSPFASDSIVVLRPKLASNLIAQALKRALLHQDKPYDFDFDFERADRLVCTEVVYRSYEGIGGIEFPLQRRAGRLTLSGSDLIQMAVDQKHFSAAAVFAPWRETSLLFDRAAGDVLAVEIES